MINEKDKEAIESTKALVDPTPPENAVVDVDYLKIIDLYPQLRDIPPRDAQVVMLFAAGMTATSIASFLAIHRNTVSNVLAKYDITRVIRNSVELQKLLLANNIGSIMVNTIAQIKKKQDQLEKMPISQAVSLLRSLVEIQKQLKPVDTETDNDPAMLIEKMRNK